MSLKLIDFTYLQTFVEIRKKMNIPVSYKVENYIHEIKFTSLSWKDPTFFEIEIKPTDENFYVGPNDEMYYDGKRVVVYIRDQSIYLPENNLNSFEPVYKFHIGWCKTLEKKTNDGTYAKYVVSTRTDGLFLVNIISNNQIAKKAEFPLKVCKNCLRKLNYKNYKNVSPEEQNNIYGNFSLEEFFSIYGNTHFNIEPEYTDQGAPENVYSENWNNISKTLKKLKRYKCDSCGISFINHPQEIHVHHIDGNKSNNNPSNLKVLCFDCHAEIHPHLRKRR